MHKVKCKICCTVMDYPHNGILSCECGEITLDAERKKHVMKTSLDNSIHVDENGLEIDGVKVDSPPPNKKELIDMLDEMVKSYENLPQHAMLNPITQYDMAAALILLSSILKTKE